MRLICMEHENGKCRIRHLAPRDFPHLKPCSRYRFGIGFGSTKNRKAYCVLHSLQYGRRFAELIFDAPTMRSFSSPSQRKFAGIERLTFREHSRGRHIRAPSNFTRVPWYPPHPEVALMALFTCFLLPNCIHQTQRQILRTIHSFWTQ